MGPIVSGIISSIIDSIIQAAMAPATMPPLDPPSALVRPTAHIDGMLAVMSPPEDGMARFDGEQRYLAAGLQIRDIENRIILPMTLEAPVPVLYQLDVDGASVLRVWVLTPEEAQTAAEIIKQKQAALQPQ